jgi:hypothetical protein
VKVKTWKLWLFSSMCFLFVAIMNLIDKEYLRGISLIPLVVIYIGLSVTYYKKDREK